MAAYYSPLGRAWELIAGSILAFAGFSLAISTGTFTPRLRYFGAPFDHEWSHLFAAARKEGIDTEDVYRMGSGRREKVLFIGDFHLAKYAARLDKVIHEHPGAPEAIMALGGGCIPISNVQTPDPARKACWPLREKAYRLASDPNVTRIVICGAWNWYFVKGDYY